ncbi:uncharacterized protein N7503_006888 [Penicillium pulvis]|uniref:uncharacterized protein n=1 Tax=Penicillium pulvis TaxID=1562058 RepID=UPI0025478318|nr:uncharacterized protein N7503_006888 [Penicillium pulvis]KAJ5797592.1 hypothetical protein N7503_006888 [Penicillium pulvis]
MEGVGLALAILPLLLNQLDNYVQGLQTLKSFRAKDHRRELDGYLSELEIQKAILVNTLEWSLDGAVEYEDGIEGPVNDHLVNLWTNPDVQKSLQVKLGRDYAAFTMTVMRLSEILDDLNRKLGWNKNPPPTPSSSNRSTFKKELKKFKEIFSKSIYADLLNRIRMANSFLKDLSEQSDRRIMMKKQNRVKGPLLKHRKNRRSALSLHRSIIHGNYNHHVGFLLSSPWLPEPERASKSSSYPRFRMIITSEIATDLQPCIQNFEIEAESRYLESNIESPPTPPRQLQDSSLFRKEARVKFAVDKGREDDHGSTPSEGSFPVPEIADICFALSSTSNPKQCAVLLGYLPDESHRHDLYRVRSIAQNFNSQSLEEVILKSFGATSLRSTNGFLFSQRHRLRLAASLACSVLEVHGSWLRNHWRARDIKVCTEPSNDLDCPFILWDMKSEVGMANMNICRDKHSNALIRSEILFPLGLVLVELSLCQTIKSLQISEDNDAIKSYADLKTAARVLTKVEMQSGLDYATVVDKCLFWPGTKSSTMDDEKMQGEMYQEIVVPLVENLRRFEGIA